MDTLSVSKIPVIHFSMENTKPGTISWLSTSKDVLTALEEHGCFKAVYDIVPLHLHKSLFSSLDELFDRPLETKKSYDAGRPYFSYLAGSATSHPLYESIGGYVHGIQSFAKALWPNGNDHFCQTAASYWGLVIGLEEIVMKMVCERYGADYNSEKEAAAYLYRYNKYRPPEKDENNLGLQIHTDKSFVTILQQNQVGGLDVKTRDGEWISPDFSPSSFVVIAGDAFLAWSNGRIRAAPHRVVMNASKTRYSAGLFVFREGTVQVPEQLVDHDHPLRFKPFDHLQYQLYYNPLTELGDGSIIKAYCGV